MRQCICSLFGTPSRKRSLTGDIHQPKNNGLPSKWMRESLDFLMYVSVHASIRAYCFPVCCHAERNISAEPCVTYWRSVTSIWRVFVVCLTFESDPQTIGVGAFSANDKVIDRCWTDKRTIRFNQERYYFCCCCFLFCFFLLPFSPAIALI